MIKVKLFMKRTLEPTGNTEQKNQSQAASLNQLWNCNTENCKKE